MSVPLVCFACLVVKVRQLHRPFAVWSLRNSAIVSRVSGSLRIERVAHGLGESNVGVGLL